MESLKIEFEVFLTRNSISHNYTNLRHYKYQNTIRTPKKSYQSSIILTLQSPSGTNGTIMLTKAKPESNFNSNSSFKRKIHITTPNLIQTTPLDKFPHSGTDEIDKISFQDSNLQMTPKFKSKQSKPSKLDALPKILLFTKFSKINFQNQSNRTQGYYREG